MQSEWLTGFGLLRWLVGIGLTILHLAVVARAITRPGRTPAARVAWVAVILLFPLIGIPAYALLGETTIGRERVRRMEHAEADLQHPLGPVPTGLDPLCVSVFSQISTVNGLPATGGNSVELLPSEDASVDALVADIDAARRNVHANFYFWLADGNRTKVVDAVARAAARGVTCRILVDALGSRAFTSSEQWKTMVDAGAECVAGPKDLPRWGRIPPGRPICAITARSW